MKRILATLVVLSAIATALAQGGQQKPATPETKPSVAMPTADQIIDKYVQAIGGKAAIEKQTSRVAKGTFEIPAIGANGTAEVYEKAPNKKLGVFTIPGFGSFQEGYDGKVGWAQDPQSGLREKSGVELATAKLEGEFFRDIKIKQLYPKMVVKGKDKVGDKEVYVVEATPAESSAETWYFDAQTGLMLRQDAERESPMGKISVQVFLDNYKDVDGLKLAFNVRQVTPQFTIEIKFDDVKHNVAIDDAKFNKPAAQ